MRRFHAILLCVLLLGTALLATTVAVANSRVVLEGKIDGATFNSILRGPLPQTRIDLSRMEGRPGGTQSWVVDYVDLQAPSAPAHSQPVRVPSARELLGYVLAPLKLGVSWLFSLFTTDASAACSGGACFWVGGTGNFSNGTHWATTSGGANCGCTPAATDTVTFDGSSGAGTATQDNASFTSGAVTIGGTITVAASSNTWTVNGNWTSSAGTFTYGTSTIVLAATANLTTVASGSEATFYNLTTSAGTLVTVKSAMGISNVLTVNGTLTDDGSFRLIYIRNDTGGTDPFVRGGSSTVTATTTFLLAFYFFNQSGTTVHIPGGTYNSILFDFSPNNIVAGLGVHFVVTSNLTFTGESQIQFVQRVGVPFYLDSDTFNMTFAGTSNACLRDGAAGAAKTGLKATSGTWTFACGAGAVSITDAVNSANFWIDFGASNWTIAGPFNASVSTNSTDWKAGSGTVTFNSTVSRSVAPPNITGNTFNNLTFNSGTGSPTYTLTTNTLRISGALTITNTTSGTITFTDATNNKGLTAASVAVGTRGALTMGSAAIADSGNWDSAAGTFTRGTGTVTLSGAGRTVANLAAGGFYNLTITGSYSFADTVTFANLTATSGTLSKEATFVNVTESNTENALITLSSIAEFRPSFGPTGHVVWTYSSASTTTSITWTINGFPGSVSVPISKNGAHFSDVTTSAGGALVLTLLGSDPTMEAGSLAAASCTVLNGIVPGFSTIVLTIFLVAVLIAVLGVLLGMRQSGLNLSGGNPTGSATLIVTVVVSIIIIASIFSIMTFAFCR